MVKRRKAFSLCYNFTNKEGNVIFIAEYQLYNDDCLNRLKLLPENSIDLVICDLPYGTTSAHWDIPIQMNDFIIWNDKKMEFPDFMFEQYKYRVSLQETISLFEKNKQLGLWSLYDRVVKPNGAILLFGVEPFSSTLRNSNPKDYRYDIYWEKERLTNVQQVKKRVGKTVETISVFYKNQCTYHPQMLPYNGPKRTNAVKNGTLGTLVDQKNKKVIPYVDKGLRYPTQVWKYPREFLREEHFATQKPLKLLQDLILTFSNEEDTVLDNTMGYGSTGRAALSVNRKFVGIELNKEHFEKAKSNIEYTVQMLNSTIIAAQ